MELRFSDRMGFTAPRAVLQVNEMDGALRNSIWNLLLVIFNARWTWKLAGEAIAVGLLKVPADSAPLYAELAARKWLHEEFFKLRWEEVYNLLEFVAPRVGGLSEQRWDRKQFMALANGILEREGSAYRFIGEQLTRISAEAEVRALEEALAKSGGVGLGGVQEHLNAAMRQLGLRPTPDYRNCIKEAILAVESTVKCISGVSGGGLADALDALSKKASIHGALRDGFLKLYGYTSDEDGIRHAILDEPNVGYDEAKFMLVGCSAFVHFLICKAEAAGLLQKNPR